jgi:uncharacterized membrane protein YphA (DoxX/SURF4 family)
MAKHPERSIDPLSPINLLVQVSRWLVGVLFVISGLIKVNDIIGFSYKLEEYFEVFHERFGFPAEPFIAAKVPLAAAISIFEVVVAVALLLGLWRRFTTGALLAMILFFTFLTGYSAITNSVTDCGCFGDALKLTPWQSFGKDVVLTVFISILYLYQDYLKPLVPRPGVTETIFVGLGGLTCGLTLLTYSYLPLIDFRPACVCCDVARHVRATNPQDGVPILADYIPIEEDCSVNPFKGAVLWVVLEQLDQAYEPAVVKLNALHAALAKTPINMLGITASPSAKITEFKTRYQPKYCISGQDQKFAKTIMRSNPGFILLKDGIVVGQWHFNAFPTPSELVERLNYVCPAVKRKGVLPTNS